MDATNNGLKRLTWVLMSIIFCALCLSVTGGFLEMPWLVYFWFVALIGMAGMGLLSMLLMIGWLWTRLVHYHQQKRHHWRDGVPGH